MTNRAQALATIALGDAVRAYQDAQADERQADGQGREEARDAAILDTTYACFEASMMVVLAEMKPSTDVSDAEILALFDGIAGKCRATLATKLPSIRKMIATRVNRNQVGA